MQILSLKAENDSPFGWKIPHLLTEVKSLALHHELDCDQSFVCSKTHKESERDCESDIRAGVERVFARLPTHAVLTPRGFAYHVRTLMMFLALPSLVFSCGFSRTTYWGANKKPYSLRSTTCTNRTQL